jgi:hypothetical protein
VEVLVLRREHVAVAGFEAAVRERVEKASQFGHPAFVRVRGLARLAKTDSSLALVSERTDGIRLSQLLDPAMKRALDMSGALMLIAQLIEAIAALHEALPGCHGAIAPERLILTPDARLMVADHVFGAALPRLSLNAEQLWDRLQIAVPDAPAPVFDQQTDLYQVGSVALALLLARPLGAGYPHRVTGQDPDNPLSLSKALEQLPQHVGGWISRTLGRRGHQAFGSSSAARDGFANILAKVDRVAGRNAVLAFHSGAPIAVSSAVRPVPVPAVTPVAVVQPEPVAKPAPVVKAEPVADSAAPVAGLHVTPVAPAAAETADHDAEAPSMSFGAVSASAVPGVVGRFFVPMTRWSIGIAAAILMMLTTGGAFAAKRYFSPPKAPVARGTLAVATTPRGANVVIDGEQRGRAPLTIELNAGEHVLQVGLDGASRTVPFSVSPGAQVSQVIDLPKAVAPTGQLQVRTEPSGAKVSVDGQKKGASPVTVEGLMPGTHTVTVEGQLGAVTQQVTIESGATASLVVPLSAPQGAPVSGWISVAAPIDVQIFEKGQLIGSNRLDKIMASVGRHDLEIVNEALGLRLNRTITVTPGQVSSMRIDPPRGTLSLNAVPWAEVFIDGNRAGETPIGNVQLPIGPHEVVFRHPELGEQRFTAMVTAATPARLSADFRRTQ